MYHLWALQPRLYQWSFRSISAFDQIIANCSSYQTGGFIYFWANNGFLKWGFQVKHYHRLKACGCASLQSSARAIPAPPSIPQDSQSPWHFPLPGLFPERDFYNWMETASLQNHSWEGWGWARLDVAESHWLFLTGVLFVCVFMPSHRLLFLFFYKNVR